MHAVVLEPLSATFPAAGEVVILKRIGDGRIRVRSRHLYKNQPVTEEFDEIQLAKLRVVPDTDKTGPRLRTGTHRFKPRAPLHP